MGKRHAYLVAIMDWKTRAVLAWEVSNTMDSGFCVGTLSNAMRDRQGASPASLTPTKAASSPVWSGLDRGAAEKRHPYQYGRERPLDGQRVYRALWRSLKYERIRLYSYATVSELKAHVAEWMDYYNKERKYQHLDYQTPWSLYAAAAARPEAA